MYYIESKVDHVLYWKQGWSYIILKARLIMWYIESNVDHVLYWKQGWSCDRFDLIWDFNSYLLEKEPVN